MISFAHIVVFVFTLLLVVSCAPLQDEERRSPDVPTEIVSPDPENGVYKGGYATFYYQYGVAGACEQVHGDDDLIGAMDANRYYGRRDLEDVHDVEVETRSVSRLCGRSVKITNTQNGKSVVVRIADACPGCKNHNSIDLSSSGLSFDSFHQA
ncbi:hypothetical protein FISHEDRAFT_60445 [Fistulina hepatica ATCC 64428]|uniref:RlpA-like protein double-psi beta-barrel domain-containing protein n=1 Tax=Fistulina hepatica ATCC 64428 TaxID=1128425 RepID=A0A0D7A5Q2_9AGAR|nr:hypothetical protein FISHEDRAFT_60445 [Fistulina hepatica ATCC 64428]